MSHFNRTTTLSGTTALVENITRLAAGDVFTSRDLRALQPSAHGSAIQEALRIALLNKLVVRGKPVVVDSGPALTSYVREGAATAAPSLTTQAEAFAEAAEVPTPSPDGAGDGVRPGESFSSRIAAYAKTIPVGTEFTYAKISEAVPATEAIASAVLHTYVSMGVVEKVGWVPGSKHAKRVLYRMVNPTKIRFRAERGNGGVKDRKHPAPYKMADLPDLRVTHADLAPLDVFGAPQTPTTSSVSSDILPPIEAFYTDPPPKSGGSASGGSVGRLTAAALSTQLVDLAAQIEALRPDASLLTDEELLAELRRRMPGR